MKPVVGWDIGGANLKLALIMDGAVHQTLQFACPLWQGLDKLEQCLVRAGEMLASPRATARHALTLTGELVDLFPDRKTGVQQILDLVTARLPGPLSIYAGPDGLISPATARERPASAASANWHGTAQLLALRGVEGVLVDTGSTTTDIVPVQGGQVRHRALGDHDRLISGELVYTGVLRTPVMAMARSVRVGRSRVPLIAEHFANAADVHRLTGDLAPTADPWPTLDNGPTDATGSARRLLRMIGRDLDSDGIRQARAVAVQLRNAQLRTMERVFRRLADDTPGPVVAAGSGRFLVRRLAERLGRPCVDFEQACAIGRTEDGADLANFAPAVAVALLAGGAHG